MPEWAHVVALTNLTEANYKLAIDLLAEDAEQISQTGFGNALMSLIPKTNSQSWPIGAVLIASDFLYKVPESVAARDIETALVELEAGQLTAAEESFRRALATEPETVHRPLAAYYLYQLTGKDDVDLLPPSERIPILFAPEPGTEQEPEKATEPSVP